MDFDSERMSADRGWNSRRPILDKGILQTTETWANSVIAILAGIVCEPGQIRYQKWPIILLDTTDEGLVKNRRALGDLRAAIYFVRKKGDLSV